MPKPISSGIRMPISSWLRRDLGRGSRARCLQQIAQAAQRHQLHAGRCEPLAQPMATLDRIGLHVFAGEYGLDGGAPSPPPDRGRASRARNIAASRGARSIGAPFRHTAPLAASRLSPAKGIGAAIRGRARFAAPRQRGCVLPARRGRRAWAGSRRRHCSGRGCDHPPCRAR